MDISNLSPSPNSTSYYKRLDIPEDADFNEIKKAGKVAMSEYSERGTETVLRLKKARTVLTDEYYRDVYDGFVSDFGVETGTRAFEDWQQAGEMPIEEFKNRIDSAEEASSSGDQRISTVSVGTPSIIEAKSDYDREVSVNLWDDQRLYINNFYDGDDIYIDLDDGEIYTSGYRKVGDVEYEFLQEEDSIRVMYGPQFVCIDLEDQSWDIDTENIEDVGIEWASDGVGIVSARYWSKNGITPRIYINGFYDDDLYIDTDTGSVFNQSTNEIVDSITCAVTSGEEEIIVSDQDNRTIKISLLTEEKQSTPTPTPNDTQSQEKEDDVVDDHYDGKEFGYDPKEQSSDDSDGRENDNTEPVEESNSNDGDDEVSELYFGEDDGNNHQNQSEESSTESSDDPGTKFGDNQDVSLRFGTLFEYLENSDNKIANYIATAVYIITFPGVVTFGFSLSLGGILMQGAIGASLFGILLVLPSIPVGGGVIAIVILLAIIPLYPVSFLMYPGLSNQEAWLDVIGGHGTAFASIPFVYFVIVLYTTYQLPSSNSE
jgi:hypothetical protein